MKWNYTPKLEKKIIRYLQDLDLVNLAFFDGIHCYLKNSQEQFLNKKIDVQQRESQLDLLRRDIEWELYSKMLIPESRADILELLENLDEIADSQERIIMQFHSERPNFDKTIIPGIIELLAPCQEAIKQVIQAALGFFSNHRDNRQVIKRVGYYEHEADLLEEKVKIELFQLKEPGLSTKMHNRDFIDHLAYLADLAEDIADRISIYSVKREI